jgi:dTDP-D-glucose 4,6-dehydratase
MAAGMQVHDWIHVRDHRAAIHCVCTKGTPGKVYNIGGRCEKTNLEMTHALLTALHKPTSLVRTSLTAPATTAATPSKRRSDAMPSSIVSV